MEAHKVIQDFFSHYENRTNAALSGEEPEVDEVVKSFSNCFVEASPKGVICGKNNAEFRKAIPDGYEFYKKIGITAMVINAIEVSDLDELHMMAKVFWRSDYLKKDKTEGSIEFEVIYMLHKENDEYKIFAYITGDEQMTLKENGLI